MVPIVPLPETIRPKRKRPPQSDLYLPRKGTFNPLPWVKASGPKDVLSVKAAYYLHIFDHKTAAEHYLDTPILAHVVCNLRNYYQQDVEQTVELITKLFNPKSWEVVWSPEAIRLCWEYVERFTPSLGFDDVDAVAKRRAEDLEDAVLDLIAYTVPGGRVSGEDLRATFTEWYQDLEFTSVAFGRAVSAVTGMKTRSSGDKRYWYGFHIPTPEELAEREMVTAAAA